jgi:transposase InsO family protein
MPWKECSVMDQRLRFVAKLLDGEAMSDTCREFGISRKTGYKIFNRYKESGFEALSDRCRRPVRYANQLPPQIESLIVSCKREKPHWGARKIRELLVRRLDQDLRIPAKSTIHAVLHRHGLVRGLGRSRRRATGTELSAGGAPNDLWCADFKGEFKLGNGQYCYPLTVTDHASRYLLMCEALESTREATAITAFEQTLSRTRPAFSHPLGQRRPLRQPQRAVQSLQAFGLVAAAGHCDRAHQAWPPAAKRPPRAHALDAQAAGDTSARHELPAAASALR